MLKFTVITTCYNAEKYIEETMLSVLTQSDIINDVSKLQYIIIDANSTDNTQSIIQSYIKKFDCIHYIREGDSGMYDGLAKGFKLADGEIVSYINAGDFYNKTTFSILRKVFSDKNISWVTGLKTIYNEDSEITDIQYPYKYRKRLIRSGTYGKNLPFIQQESTFWRKSLLELVDFDYLVSLKRSGDSYLWFCFAKKHELIIINSYLSGFKYHSNQLTFKETGSTDIYLLEAKKFFLKKNLIDYILIILDAPLWFISKYFSKILKKFNTNNLIYSNSKWTLLKTKGIKIWACDFSSNNGEGILARSFINNFFDDLSNTSITIRNHKYSINYNNFKNFYFNNKKLTFFDKYISPYIGIIYLWYNFFLGNKTIYINFLPFWNFIIFLFLPPNTILGPITGTTEISKEMNDFEKVFRKYLMPICFRISNLILRFRFNNIIFSTNMMQKYLSKDLKSRAKFNYVLNNYFLKNFSNKSKINDNKTKNNDLVIYIRKNSNKGYKNLIKILELLKKDFKIVTVGEKLNIKGIVDYGILQKEKLYEICRNSKFTIASYENLFSLFILDCLICDVKVLFDKKKSYEIDEINNISEFPVKNMVGIDFDDDKILNQIQENIKKTIY